MTLATPSCHSNDRGTTEVQSPCMRVVEITECGLWVSREMRLCLGGVEVIEER